MSMSPLLTIWSCWGTQEYEEEKSKELSLFWSVLQHFCNKLIWLSVIWEVVFTRSKGQYIMFMVRSCQGSSSEILTQRILCCGLLNWSYNSLLLESQNGVLQVSSVVWIVR